MCNRYRLASDIGYVFLESGSVSIRLHLGRLLEPQWEELSTILQILVRIFIEQRKHT